MGQIILTFTPPAVDDKLVVTSVPGSATAGVDFSVTVQAQDNGGTPITVTQDTPIALVASGSGTLSGNTATILNGQDSVTLSNVQYTTAESITLSGASTAGDVLNNGGESSAFTVAPGAAAQVAFTTQPSASSPATIPFATQPVVEIQDAFGNTVTTGPDATVNVALTLTTGTGTLSGTTSMSAVAGVADFAGMGLNIDETGTDKVLTAAATIGAGAVNTTTDPAFTITDVELTWLGSPATHNWTTAAEVNWSGGTGVYVEPAHVIFDESGSAASPINLVGTLSPVSVTVDSDTKDYTFSTTGSGMISGTTGLLKRGASTLTLDTANDFSGTTDFNVGTLNINHAEALGTGTFDINTGVTIDNTSGGPIVNTNDNPILLRGVFTFAGTDDLDLGDGTVSMLFGNRTIDVAAGNLTLGGQITESGGARNLTKTGLGTLTLSGANSYTGVTTVNAGGTLKNGSDTTFTTQGSLDVDGATTTFDLNGFDASFTSLTDDNNVGIITNSAGGDAKTITFTNTANDNDAGKSAQFTGNLALAFANSNSSATMWGLRDDNTFTGGLTLLDGSGSSGTRLRVNETITGTPFGTGPITIGEVDTDNAGFMLDAVANTISNDLIFNTALGSDVPGIRVQNPNIVFSGTVTANLADATFATGKDHSGAGDVTGKVTGSSGLALTPPGDTISSVLTLTLSNASMDNDYAGDTTISTLPGADYTLALGAADQIPNGSGTGNVVNDGTLDLNTFSETINGLSGTGIVDTIAGGTPVLTVGDNDQTSTFDGVIQNTTGTLALTKIGTGTLTLTGANTYTGATSVNEGTLGLGGGSTDSAITVADGAFLGWAVGTAETTSTADLTFVAGSKVTISGVPTLASYTLITANAIVGTPELDSPIAGYSLVVDGSSLKLEADGFSGWIGGTFANGTVTLQGPDDDEDGDGTSNLMEYAIAGMDPTVADAPPGTLTGTTFSFDKRQPLASDITYLIEESTDLGAIDPWTEVSGGSYVNDGTTISYTMPTAPDPKNFVRLKVTQN